MKRQEESTKLTQWFNREDKYSQGSFILSILQWCESHLIFTIGLSIFSIQDLECKCSDFSAMFERCSSILQSLAEDEDHRSDLNNYSRLKLSSALSYPSSSKSPIPPSVPILKRPKTASAASLRQKSAVSFASSALDNNDSDTEQRAPSTRIPRYKDFIRQLPIYLAKSILSILDQKSLNKCKFVSLYWKKMAMEVEDETTMSGMLYDDMMLLQVNDRLSRD